MYARYARCRARAVASVARPRRPWPTLAPCRRALARPAMRRAPLITRVDTRTPADVYFR